MIKQAETLGITERKKTELDALRLSVTVATEKVAQSLALVTSLTEKASKFQNLLKTANTNMAGALSNKNLADQLSLCVLDLKKASAIASDTIKKATESSSKLAEQMSTLIGKLIFAAEKTNKLTNLVVRQRALNPLVSDELVNQLVKAAQDANKAVTLTLVALQSSFAAMTSNAGSSAAIQYETELSVHLYEAIAGQTNDSEPQNSATTLTQLLHKAYSQAEKHYQNMLSAYNETTAQLTSATLELNNAQVELKSLQAGLSAATAAAFAS